MIFDTESQIGKIVFEILVFISNAMKSMDGIE